MSDVAFDLLFGPDFVTTTTSWGLADAAAATAAPLKVLLFNWVHLMYLEHS